ncbi:MAG: histidine kinase N-terminal 7TM domain-containing protein, partial [Candidatus Moranbacteria bacterium]|nr:histidine kinase N-terminal 7TM domain-containing protein [Candidatus Moranbacteria bacterium]
MDLNKIFAISAFINGVTALSLSIVVLFGAKKNFANRIFALFAFFIWLWSFGYYFWLSSESYESANFWVGILNLGSTFIPITYYHWIITVLHKKRRPLIFLGYILTFAFALFSSSKLFYTELISIAGFNFWPVAGALYFYYVLILYGGFFFVGLFDVVHSFIKEKGERKVIAKFILAASLISLISGASNFPLWFGIKILPYGNFIVFVHVFLFSYAMTRYNLMNMKTMSMQVAISFISIIALIEVIVSNTIQEFLMRVFLFIIIVFFSYLLIKSSRETVKQKEELEILSKKLAKNNRKLKELDDAKNE